MKTRYGRILFHPSAHTDTRGLVLMYTLASLAADAQRHLDNAERAHSGCAQVERQRRAQASRADTQHLRSFDLELPLHADFRHDEVARIAQNFVVGERDRGCFS
jgi:hypothetical protein